VRALRALVAAALAAAGLAFAPSAPAATGPTLSLVSMPAWVERAGTVVMHVGLMPGDATTLRVRVHQVVKSSSAFDDIVQGGSLRGVTTVASYDPTTLPRDSDGSAIVSFGLTGSAWPTTVAVSSEGVYPLELALYDDTGDVVASLVTWLVVVNPNRSTPLTKLLVAPVWRLGTGPVRKVDLTFDQDAAAELAPGARVDNIATLLASSPSIPLSLQVGPETIEAWAALAKSQPAVGAGLQRVRDALSRSSTQVLPSPYVPIDETSLEGAGLGGQLPDQLVAGSDAIEATSGVTPDPRTAIVDPVNAPTLSRLRDLLVDRVVISDDALGDVGDDSSATRAPFSLGVGTGTMRAVAGDTSLQALLRGSDPAPARVQRALAGLSVAAFEAAGAGEPRGVVLLEPARWAPDLDADRPFFATLASHPLLQPATLDALFRDVPAATRDNRPVLRELAPRFPKPFPLTSDAYARAQARLSSLRATLGADDPDVQRGARALVLALSTDNSATEAAADLHVIDDAVARLTAGVSTQQKRVTLTARQADVPLSFSNTTGKPVTVRVRLASAKLTFPNGTDRVLTLPEGNSTDRFRVEARASGTFPMTVSVSSQDGTLTFGAPTRITVRSAVFSGVGAILTVAALVFLVLWWGNHFRRTRRERRAAPAS
jgi:hypothetical protein